VKFICTAAALLACATTAAAQDREVAAAPAGPASAAASVSPVTDAMLRQPAPGDWLMWRRTLNSWGYSPLTQITPRNVGQLRLVWSRGLPAGKQEGTPLVHDGVLFMPEPNDGISAYDAVTGDQIWEYRRPMPADLKNFIPHPDTNRNIAIWQDLIIDTSADDYVFALDAKTGKLVWQTQITDYRTHAAQQTAGPIVADGKVISGRGCEPRGGPQGCVVTAHDARTGKELWRTSTIAKPGEPGGDSWGDIPYEQRWHVGTWMVPSYDPELKLVYFGTSVTSPAPKFALAGNDKKYLYNNSTLALDVETGKIVWYYQHVVDNWDLDHTFERYIVDTAIAPDPKAVAWINPKLRAGERRKVITGIPGKTGVVYTLDAKTGEFLWATPTVEQTVIKSIDPATGEVTINPDSLFNKIGDERRICPNSMGGKNWPAGAYSPAGNVMFFPLSNTCATVTAILDKPSLQSLYGYRSRGTLATLQKSGNNSPNPNVGTVRAISAETGRTLWQYEQRAAMMSLVATGGGVLFGGDANGRFRAFDQKTGKVLWETNLGAPVSGYPISYAVDGKQYVVASVGPSLTAGGLNALTPELRPGSSNTLFVFALP
jgi:alcohol dehydrogenase (cytochrome c)